MGHPAFYHKSDPHLVFIAHYPILYSTNLSTLIGLRILTHYSSFDLTVHYNLPPLLYLQSMPFPVLIISNSLWLIQCFITTWTLVVPYFANTTILTLYTPKATRGNP